MRDWRPLVDDMSPVMKLVHLAARATGDDVEGWRKELLKQRRRAYNDELGIQATRLGCSRVGLLTNNSIISELNNSSLEDARSINNTYNYDLGTATYKIREEYPRANRHTYAAKLREWDENRSIFKVQQIENMTSLTARAKAQQDFHANNITFGMAILRPGTAVCPICKGWLARGEVELMVAMNNPPPYHVNCHPPQTIIKTPDGEKRIDEIKVGDIVHTRYGKSAVLQVFERYTEEAVYSLFAEGLVLEATGDHPILTWLGWIPMQDLQAGNLIATVQTHEIIKYIPIAEITSKPYTGKVFSLQTEVEEYIAEGVVVHNCPHYWDIYSDRLTQQACKELWMGE